MIDHLPHCTGLLLAMVNMSGNLVAAVVFLALGVSVLRSIKAASGRSEPRRWLVGAAILCGPALAFAFWLADIFWISPDSYLLARDYVESLTPILFIGLIAGTLCAAAIWIAECASCRRGPNLADLEGNLGEQSHALETGTDPLE